MDCYIFYYRKLNNVRQRTNLNNCRYFEEETGNDTLNANGALGRDRTYNLASGGPRDIHFTTRAHLLPPHQLAISML